MPLNIISLILNYWKPLMAGLALVVYSLFWYTQGYAHAQAKWDASIVAATVQAKITENNNALLGAKIGGKYAESTNAIDANFNAALARMRGDSGGNLPSKGLSAPRTNAGSTCHELPRANREALYELMRAAQKQTNQLVLLQEFERESK